MHSVCEAVHPPNRPFQQGDERWGVAVAPLDDDVAFPVFVDHI
jgi:hypothetical protein